MKDPIARTLRDAADLMRAELLISEKRYSSPLLLPHLRRMIHDLNKMAFVVEKETAGP